jgi:ribosomal protein L34E
MSAETVKTGKCKRCGEVREVTTAKLLGGATHGRPARPYPSNLCAPCAGELVVDAADGRRTVDGWDVQSVRWARVQFARAARA